MVFVKRVDTYDPPSCTIGCCIKKESYASVGHRWTLSVESDTARHANFVRAKVSDIHIYSSILFLALIENWNNKTHNLKCQCTIIRVTIRVMFWSHADKFFWYHLWDSSFVLEVGVTLFVRRCGVSRLHSLRSGFVSQRRKDIRI